MTIRADIYPNLRDTLLWRRDERLNKYLDEARSALSRFFHSREEIIEYVNGLPNREDAELFLDVCGFYNIAKNYARLPFLKFIMIISVMERLCVRKYRLFIDWLRMKENQELVEKELESFENRKLESFKEIIKRLNAQYLEIFSLRKKLFEFIWKYLEDNEKIMLVKSFRTKRTRYLEEARYTLTPRYQSIEEYAEKMRTKVGEGWLPNCYDWQNCWIQYGRCHPNIRCVLCTNQKALKRQLNIITRIIYAYRSMFVHKARLPPFSENGEMVSVIDIYEEKPIMIEFKITDFEIIIENAFKRYFDILQKV